MIFLQLFYTFFKIGLFGFGGGYAMISMIQGEVVTRNEWLSSTEFTDIIAISQMTPGPIGINSATYVGYSAVVNAGYSHAIGVLGSTVATVSVVLPSFILMVLISKFFLKYQKHPIIASVFKGLRPGVVGLLKQIKVLSSAVRNYAILWISTTEMLLLLIVSIIPKILWKLLTGIKAYMKMRKIFLSCRVKKLWSFLLSAILHRLSRLWPASALI